MSLEKRIQELTEAVLKLTEVMSKTSVPQPPPAAVAVEPEPVFTPEVKTVDPVENKPTVVMPPTPSFAAPAPVEAPSCPFTDSKGLIEYLMNTYKEIGPSKGAAIQNILNQLGYQHVNDVKPEHYGALFLGVEKLK